MAISYRVLGAIFRAARHAQYPTKYQLEQEDHDILSSLLPQDSEELRHHLQVGNLDEAERGRQEANWKHQEAERGRQEAERGRQEAERGRQEAEQLLAATQQQVAGLQQQLANRT